MNKLIIVIFAGFLFLTTACAVREELGFKIRGSMINLPDSTMILLDDLSTGSLIDIDSTWIIGGKFEFKGVVKEKAMHTIIRTKDYSDISYLWLENSDLTFVAEKGKFREATITGSRSQQEQHHLDSAIRVAGNEEAQLKLFIRAHPSSIVSANVLSIFASSWGRDTAAVLFEPLSSELKNTSYGKNVSDFITLSKDVGIGRKYADFTQQNAEGKNVKLSDFDGKVVLLEFWGSWCGPCRQGHPEMVQTYNEFKNKGFEILGVAAETSEKPWREAIRLDQLTWQNVTDFKGDKNKAALIYGISYYPANFLIDKNGTIIAKDIRGELLRKKLSELLKQ